MEIGDALAGDVLAVDLGKFRVATYQSLSGLSLASDVCRVSAGAA